MPPGGTIPRALAVAVPWQTRIASNAALLGFLLLFPGFFAYQALIAARVMPPIVGGGAGVAAVVTLVAFAVVALRGRARMLRLHGALELIVVLFLGYVLVWAAVNSLIEPRESTNSAWLQTLQTVVYLISLVLIGRHLPLTAPWFHRFILVTWLLMTGYTVGVAVAYGEVFVYDTPLFTPGEGVASYQGTARSVFVVGLSAVGLARSPSTRLLVTVGSIAALFVVGARSEFVGFAFAATLLWGMWLTRGVKSWVAILAATAVFATVAFSVDWSFAFDSRQSQLLDLDSATSWRGRTELLNATLEMIRSEPLFGRFDSHVTSTGETGAYAHNALSAWTAYGFVGFVLYAIVLVTAAARSGLAALKGTPPLCSGVRIRGQHAPSGRDRQVRLLGRAGACLGPRDEPNGGQSSTSRADSPQRSADRAHDLDAVRLANPGGRRHALVVSTWLRLAIHYPTVPDAFASTVRGSLATRHG